MYEIKVNGKTHGTDMNGDTPLLWVLRGVFGMTGAKSGCGMALCGACAVHIDGNIESAGQPRHAADHPARQGGTTARRC